jgi:hypothetical protein
MASAFENLPDDVLYTVRTFLDFTAEMALDSTSHTIRSVMRDVVHPRCKVFDVDNEITGVTFPNGICPVETIRKYALKICKHTQTYKNFGTEVTMILPRIPMMPALKNLLVSAPFSIDEDAANEVHMFSDSVILFWQRIWEYLESGKLERLCVYSPKKFSINNQHYTCDEPTASRIYLTMVEDIYVHDPTNPSELLTELRIPRTSVWDSGRLYDMFPNARIFFWEEMNLAELEKQSTLNRLMLSVL